MAARTEPTPFSTVLGKTKFSFRCLPPSQPTRLSPRRQPGPTACTDVNERSASRGGNTEPANSAPNFFGMRRGGAGGEDGADRPFYQLGELPFDRLAGAAPAALPRQLAEKNDAEDEWDDDSSDDSESDSYEARVGTARTRRARRRQSWPAMAQGAAPEQSRARAACAVQLWSLSEAPAP